MRGTAGETTFCTGEDPRESKEKKKEGLRKKDREAPRPNSLLTPLLGAGSVMHRLQCTTAGQEEAWVSLRQPLATDTSGGDPGEALPEFPSLQS